MRNKTSSLFIMAATVWVAITTCGVVYFWLCSSRSEASGFSKIELGSTSDRPAAQAPAVH